MSSLNGPHVRIRSAFINSPRFLMLSSDAQALWLHLEGKAVAERREFLPVDYRPASLAFMWHKPAETVERALTELISSERPIVNVLHDPDCELVASARERGANALRTLCECGYSLRVRGAREKHPVSWENEVIFATHWNKQYPDDPLDLDAFGERVVQGQARAAQQVTASGRKRGSNAKKRAATGDKRAATSRESSIGEESIGKDRRSPTNAIEAGLSALPTGAQGPPNTEEATTEAAPPLREIDPGALSLFRGLTSGWDSPGADNHQEEKTKAESILRFDPARVCAYALQINDTLIVAGTEPWAAIAQMCYSFPPPRDDDYDEAKKRLREVMA